jgi:hypothetical protein
MPAPKTLYRTASTSRPAAQLPHESEHAEHEGEDDERDD